MSATVLLLVCNQCQYFLNKKNKKTVIVKAVGGMKQAISGRFRSLFSDKDSNSVYETPVESVFHGDLDRLCFWHKEL